MDTYWVDFDADLDIVVDGVPVRVLKPGGTVIEIDLVAYPEQAARFLHAHPEAIHLSAGQRQP